MESGRIMDFNILMWDGHVLLENLRVVRDVEESYCVSGPDVTVLYHIFDHIREQLGYHRWYDPFGGRFKSFGLLVNRVLFRMDDTLKPSLDRSFGELKIRLINLCSSLGSIYAKLICCTGAPLSQDLVGFPFDARCLICFQWDILVRRGERVLPYGPSSFTGQELRSAWDLEILLKLLILSNGFQNRCNWKLDKVSLVDSEITFRSDTAQI